jgi:tetratricopeptide (TPR) repeat protein
MPKFNVFLTLMVLTGLSVWKSLPQQFGEEAQTRESGTQSSLPYGSSGEVSTQARGRSALQVGNDSEALIWLKKAAAENPKDLSLRVALGATYLHLGQCDCALHQLNYVLSQVPDHAGALLLRAEVYTRQGNFAAAAADLQRGLSHDASAVPFWRQLARVQAAQGDLESALASQRVALSYAPLVADLWQERARYHVLQGDARAAQGAADQAQRIYAWQQSVPQRSATNIDWQLPQETIGPRVFTHPDLHTALHLWGYPAGHVLFEQGLHHPDRGGQGLSLD